MTQEEIKDLLAEHESDCMLFESPDYCSAFIGLSHDNRAVYSYEKMIDYLVCEEGCSDYDARDIIDYDTINSIGVGNKYPIVVFEYYNI